MEPTRTALFIVALAATLFAAGCGTRAGALCDRAIECNAVDDDNFRECKDDINDAVSDGDLEASEVRECNRCVYDNDCGLDILIDCETECENVFDSIWRSNI